MSDMLYSQEFINEYDVFYKLVEILGDFLAPFSQVNHIAL